MNSKTFIALFCIFRYNIAKALISISYGMNHLFVLKSRTSMLFIPDVLCVL